MKLRPSRPRRTGFFHPRKDAVILASGQARRGANDLGKSTTPSLFKPSNGSAKPGVRPLLRIDRGRSPDASTQKRGRLGMWCGSSRGGSAATWRRCYRHDGVDWPPDLRAPHVEIRRAIFAIRFAMGSSRPPMISRSASTCWAPAEADAARATETITRGAQFARAFLRPARPGRSSPRERAAEPILENRRLPRWVELFPSRDRSLDKRLSQPREILPLSWMYHNLCVYRPPAAAAWIEGIALQSPARS